MIKKKLLKTVMLGLFMATITTGSAYATLAEDTPSATEEVSDQTKALYAKQEEVDKLLFNTNAKEIEKLGFMVNYTNVVEDTLEIGISPYNEDNANYIYELVGKDGVMVIEFNQAVLYASGAAPDAADIRTIAATDEKAKDEVSAPIIVLAIVGGAALVGGAVLLINKKKASK